MRIRRSSRRIAGTGLACATAVLTATATPATAVTAPAAPHPTTRANALHAMHGEALANATYHAFATQAGHQRLPRIRTLFMRTAHQELHEHFAEQARLIGFVRDDAANLRESIAGEREEATRTYPRFAAEARRDGDLHAARLFTQIARDEARHAREFQRALDAVIHRRPDSAIPEGPTTSHTTAISSGLRATSPRTLRNLRTAMRAEAFAHAKYALYAAHARTTRRPRLARLFHRTAHIELTRHFTAEAHLAGAVHDTRANLRRSIAGETREATVMYPLYARQAIAAGDHDAARLFAETAHDEARHARQFRRALRELGR